MKKLTSIILLFFTTYLFSQSSVTNIDAFIKQNFLKSNSFKKQLVRSTKKCNLNEIYFVQGYNSKKKLVERFVVFSKNNKFTRSNNFIYWAAQKHPVLYYHADENSEESPKDLQTLKIIYKKGKFEFINTYLQKLNAQEQKKLENGTSSEEHISEASGSGYFVYDDYLEEVGC